MHLHKMAKQCFFISALVSLASLGSLYAIDSSQIAAHEEKGKEEHHNANNEHHNVEHHNDMHHNQNFNAHHNEEFNRNVNPAAAAPAPQSPTIVVPNQNNQTPQDIYNQNQNTQK